MAKHLQDFTATAQWVAKALSVAADEIAIADSAAAKAPKLLPISGLAGIPAANIVNTPAGNLAAVNVQAALNELQTEVDAINAITGQYEGSSATFAGLPTGGTVADGDWAILTADDGGNQSGIYVRAAGAWTLGKEIPEPNIAVMTGATAGAAGTSGLAPQPAAGDQVRVLTGAATYVDPTTLVSDMGAATAGAAGTAGLVPAPAAGDQVRFLTGGGTYLDAPAASLQATTDVGNVTTNAIEITAAGVGYIMASADAQRWSVTVDNDGSLTTTAI